MGINTTSTFAVEAGFYGDIGSFKKLSNGESGKYRVFHNMCYHKEL